MLCLALISASLVHAYQIPTARENAKKSKALRSYTPMTYKNNSTMPQEASVGDLYYHPRSGQVGRVASVRHGITGVDDTWVGLVMADGYVLFSRLSDLMEDIMCDLWI
jgi:hypothetical protein